MTNQPVTLHPGNVQTQAPDACRDTLGRGVTRVCQLLTVMIYFIQTAIFSNKDIGKTFVLLMPCLHFMSNTPKLITFLYFKKL